jgi:hypothetical protein
MAAAAALLLAPLASAQTLTTSCEWVYNGATYNLAGMTRPSSGYVVQDVRDPATSYVFNVCGEVAAPTILASACVNQTAEAYQAQFGTNTCYTLGQRASAGWNFSVYGACPGVAGLGRSDGRAEDSWCGFGHA